MTPLHIEILFWYHTRGNEFRDGDPDTMTAPAVREALDLMNGAWALLKVRERDAAIRQGIGRTYSCAPIARTNLGNAMTPTAQACAAHVILDDGRGPSGADGDAGYPTGSTAKGVSPAKPHEPKGEM